MKWDEKGADIEDKNGKGFSSIIELKNSVLI